MVISGPSGAGKSTVGQTLRNQGGDFYFSISCTTRSPRPDEIDGRDYYFVSQAEFDKKISSGEFLEYAEVHGNYYGTLSSEVFPRIENGQDVLLDIDVQGAMQIKAQARENALLQQCLELVFIGPPNYAELEKRLRSRATETEAAILLRLKNARAELNAWDKYDFLVINQDLDVAVKDMKVLIDILHKSTRRIKDPGFYE